MGRHNKTEAYRTAGVTVLKFYVWVWVWLWVNECVCVCGWVKHGDTLAFAICMSKPKRMLYWKSGDHENNFYIISIWSHKSQTRHRYIEMSASLGPMFDLLLGYGRSAKFCIQKSHTWAHALPHALSCSISLIIWLILCGCLCVCACVCCLHECLLVRTCLQSTFKRRRVFNTLSLFMPLYA